MKTTADDFIFSHEMSHKRMHEELPKWSSKDKDFMLAKAILDNGPQSEKDGNADLIELLQHRFMETYADVMAIHLSSKEFGDSPEKLSHFIAEMRHAKKDDMKHEDSFGVEALSRRLADPEVSSRFVSDRSFAEGMALSAATMNVHALLKYESGKIVPGGAFGKEMKEAGSRPLSERVEPLLLEPVVPSAQPAKGEVAAKVREGRVPSSIVPAPRKPE